MSENNLLIRGRGFTFWTRTSKIQGGQVLFTGRMTAGSDFGGFDSFTNCPSPLHSEALLILTTYSVCQCVSCTWISQSSPHSPPLQQTHRVVLPFLGNADAICLGRLWVHPPICSLNLSTWC